jgi:hypothetical protein
MQFGTVRLLDLRLFGNPVDLRIDPAAGNELLGSRCVLESLSADSRRL